MNIKIYRRATVRAVTGTPNSTMHDQILKGLFPKNIALGRRSVGWPSHEIDALIKARVAGKSEDEIRALVKALHAARKNLSEAQT